MIVARSRLPSGTLDLRAGDRVVALASPAREVPTRRTWSTHCADTG